MLTISCPSCHKSLKVRDSLAGRKVKCPGCGQAVPVPGATPVPAGGSATQDMATLPFRPSKASGHFAAAQDRTHPPAGTPEATQSAGKPAVHYDSSLTDFLAPAQTDDELGRLGKYRILKILGHGGMGVVFRAEDVQLKRSVAIKAMLPGMAASASAGKRFLREAQSMAAVEHDHIVRIYQVDEDRGVPFLAMEFLKGEPLDGRLKREEKLPAPEVLRIGQEIAEALGAAHATGLIHRDIKPANIWLESPRNRVKILDFGLARAVSEDSGLTQQGAIIGTPAYMAPEQGRGDPVDARTDLFSLGVVLYRLATGRQPFLGRDAVSTLVEIRTANPPPPIELNADMPRELSDFVMRLLEKDPTGRPASAQEVVDVLKGLERKLPRAHEPANRLEPLLATPTAKSATTRPLSVRRRRAPMLLGILLLAVLAGVGLWVAGIIRFSSEQGDLVLETDDPDFAFAVAKGGGITLEDRKTKRTFQVKAVPQGKDKYELEITDAGADLAFKTRTFTVKRGDRVALKAWFERKKDGVAVASEEAPPPAKAPFESKQARAHQEAWAKYLGKPVEWTNKLNMKFVLIPPGEFTMGASDEDLTVWPKLGDYKDGGKIAAPAHRLRLTQPYYMAERELSIAEFVELMKRLPGNVARPKDESPDGPVMQYCSWFDCVELCNRLSEREGRKPAYIVAGKNVTLSPGANGYRLPTEAEWEFACRAGTTTLWYYGLTGLEAARDLKEASQRQGSELARPNPFGLFNMYAGATEWCWDWYDPDYFRQCAARGTVVDPLGPESGKERIRRGGSSYDIVGRELSIVNSAARHPIVPEATTEPENMKWCGFGRLVLPVDALTDEWFKQVAALPAEKQLAAVLEKLKDRNPGYDGTLNGLPELLLIEGGAVVGLKLWGKPVSDLTPLRALPLKILEIPETKVTNLEQLRGMKLTELVVWQTGITDLTPLKGMPLTALNLIETNVSDLAPLAGMPLKKLSVAAPAVSNISALIGLPLTHLDLRGPHVNDLTPLKGMKLISLRLNAGQAVDLSPLKGMPLRRLAWNRDLKSGAEILRTLPNLESVNDRLARGVAASFHIYKSSGEIPSLKTDAAGDLTIEAVVTAGMHNEDDIFGTRSFLLKVSSGRPAVKLDCQGFRGIVASAQPFDNLPALPCLRTHLAAVKSAEGLRLFVDGKLAAKRDFTAPVRLDAAESFMFGGPRSTPMWLHAARVSKGARYKSDFTPQTRFTPDADTLALYHCDEGKGNVLRDASGNSHDASLTEVDWLRGVLEPPDDGKTPPKQK